MEDDEIKKEIAAAMGEAPPEESLEKDAEDPFATDALGHTPAEEDDSGSD